MTIEKINIKSFGLLTNTAMEFSDTVNVIEGQNESGKSTIAAFIKYMLYGFDNKENKDGIDERKKRVNWHTGVAEGSMNVRFQDKRYLINRSTVRTENGGRVSYKEEASIIDLETGSPVFGRNPAGEVFFGVDKTLFENTAFIGALSEARVSEDSVTTAIENILFSGSEQQNQKRATAQIAERMKTLLREDGSGGIIVDLMQKESDLSNRLAVAEENNKKILETEAALHEIRKKKEEAAKRYNDLCELDECYKNVMVIDTFDKLHALELENEKKIETLHSFNESSAKDGFVPDDAYLLSLREKRRTYNESYFNLREAQVKNVECRAKTGLSRDLESALALADAMSGEKEIMNRAETMRVRRGINIAGTIAGGLIAIAAVVFEFAAKGAAAGTVFRILAGVLGAAGLFASGVFGFSFFRLGKSLLSLCREFGTETFQDLEGKMKMIGEARKKRDEIVGSVKDAESGLQTAERKNAEAKAALTECIALWEKEMPTEDLERYLDNLEFRVTDFLSKKKELEDEKNLTEMTVKDIRASLAGKSEVDIRATVPPLRRKALEQINHEGIVNGIAACKALIAEEEEKLKEAEEGLAELKSEVQDPSLIHSKIMFIRDRLFDLRMRHKAYFLAYKTIESAATELRLEISPRLGKYTTDMLSVMTDRKYSDMDVTDGLKVSFVTADGDKKSVDFLSEGTKDLTYIAVRMALADMLFEEKPPLTFDESFAHQDNNRSRAMMAAIAHLGKDGFQSFIFTCRGREEALACDLDPNARVFKLTLGNDAETSI